MSDRVQDEAWIIAPARSDGAAPRLSKARGPDGAGLIYFAEADAKSDAEHLGPPWRVYRVLVEVLS